MPVIVAASWDSTYSFSSASFCSCCAIISALNSASFWSSIVVVTALGVGVGGGNFSAMSIPGFVWDSWCVLSVTA
eukprot:9329290-Ditylum_brightwellii.AAC.1